MGFGRTWRSWVKECVSTASISIMVNGSPSKPFKMERGLRQGDSLSPFLFVLVVDVLSRMIGEAVRNGRISPLLVGRDNIELSHLQFADDTILLCPPDEETVRNYKRLLRCFEMMSSLSINFEKSNLIPVNCRPEWVTRMCQLLGCQETALPVRYLGISLGANPRLVKTWKPIIDKVEEKLSLWKAKVLSKAGKLLPNVVARKIITLQRKFFWGKDDGRPGMALVKWELVQAPKKLGGLGVGDAVVHNAALLFKWWWWFSKEECPLWKKIVCSCYNLNPNLLLSTQKLPLRGGPWRNICQVPIKEQHVRQKMIDGLTIEVGDGRSTRFWEDTWLQVMQEKTLDEEFLSYKFAKEIWKGLVSPRVELFNWFVLVWCAWILEFGQKWAAPGTLKDHFESWRLTPLRKDLRRSWMVGFFSIIWNIWLRRNDGIFQNKITGVEDCVTQTFLCAKEWCSK
nr:uncharacterized protein LOC112774162 [Arachis hypogaea]